MYLARQIICKGNIIRNLRPALLQLALHSTLGLPLLLCWKLISEHALLWASTEQQHCSALEHSEMAGQLETCEPTRLRATDSCI